MSQPSAPHDAESEPGETGSGLDFPVVGIGASAGGLAALTRFLEAMPAKPDMAFVIVMHLSPKHDSIVDRILQRSTAMPVIQVTEQVALRKNEVYVISPRKALSMFDGCLQLVDMERPRGRHVAIDFFFRTLAEAHRERAFAVILTGTGSDGSVGISRIREHGGITFAQLPEDAEYDQMPRAAIATGAVDIVLPVAELPERILDLAREAKKIVIPDAHELGIAVNEPEDEAEARVDEEALRDIMLILRAKTGHDFRAYKRATVLRRIERRLQVNGLHTLEEYRDFLHDNVHERPALLKDMLISVTNFFRDREAFEELERTVVPELFQGLGENSSVRAWSAGCATGEEAYSLAMLLSEAAAATSTSVQVFATDIDDDAIAFARHGCYPSAVMTDIAPTRVSRFLTREDGIYRVQKTLREKVLFARHDVLQDPPFSKLDLIACRNLLIYLNRDVQAHALEMFHFALRPGGYLFLGSSESAEIASKHFTPVDKKHRIYRANAIGRSGLYLHTPSRQPLTMSVPGSPTIASVAQERRTQSLADIHGKALVDQAPPSILIDREGHVAHMSESAGPYLRMTGGAPSYQLTSLIVPELRLELRTSVFQSAQDGKMVRSRPVDMERDGKTLSVTVEVRPVRDQEQDTGYQLVILHEDSAQGPSAMRDHDREQTPILLQLEEELKRAKEQLQVTIEDSETSNEELKASNEELQSINEELRSATEELETSKEELQSINEELITVNHELKLKVEETAKANDDLHNLVASTDIATVFVDRTMCIKRFTPRAADVFRLIQADIGRSLLDLNHSLDYPELAADANRAFHSLHTIEREVGSLDGRWYITRILPYRTAEDRIEGAVLTFVDITRRRAAERELEELLDAEKASREEAQTTVQLKDEFLAVMSHELKHPLNLIMMNAELVARTAASTDDAASRRAAEAITRTVQGQAQIIDDLLDLSRLNTGKLALNPSAVNLSECVRRVAEAMRTGLSGRNIALDLRLPEEDLVLLADHLRIEQVIWNLLSNASNYTSPGGRIAVRLASDGNEATLEVEDDGMGIPADIVDRVFDMFEQGAQRVRPGAGGLGIGLALVRHLVELHGGTVSARSGGIGKGSCFVVRLPVSAALDVRHPEPLTEDQGPRLTGRRIIIVDDSEELLGPFSELLRMEGASVSVAHSGMEALPLLALGEFGTLLSDIGMPDMDGHELVSRLRELPGGKDIVAVALTGFGRPQDERAALKAGFDAHLGKPVSMQLLVDTLLRIDRERQRPKR